MVTMVIMDTIVTMFAIFTTAVGTTAVESDFSEERR